MSQNKLGQTTTMPKFHSLSQEAFLGLWPTYDRLHAVERRFRTVRPDAQQYNALRLLRAAAPATLPTLTLAGSLVSKAADVAGPTLDAAGAHSAAAATENRQAQLLFGITAAGLQLLRTSIRS